MILFWSIRLTGGEDVSVGNQGQEDEAQAQALQEWP